MVHLVLLTRHVVVGFKLKQFVFVDTKGFRTFL